jgi:hypothetical protein
MPISQKNFTGDADFTATYGEMMDAEDSRDRIAEERTINPLFAKVSDMDQTGTTTGS